VETVADPDAAEAGTLERVGAHTAPVGIAGRPGRSLSAMTEPKDELDTALDKLAVRSEPTRLMQALIYGADVLGGPAGWVTLLSQKWQEAIAEDSIEYLRAVTQRLRAVEDRLNLEDPDIASIVHEILEKGASEKQRQKRAYWASLAAHVAVHESGTAAERRRMVDDLDALRPSHLRLLHVIGTGEPPVGYGGGGAVPYIAFMMPDMPVELIPLDWTDLVAHGLATGLPAGMTAVTPDWQRVQQSLTVYGRRFIEFVEA
jgi:hypothetical protein